MRYRRAWGLEGEYSRPPALSHRSSGTMLSASENLTGEKAGPDSLLPHLAWGLFLLHGMPASHLPTRSPTPCLPGRKPSLRPVQDDIKAPLLRPMPCELGFPFLYPPAAYVHWEAPAPSSDFLGPMPQVWRAWQCRLSPQPSTLSSPLHPPNAFIAETPLLPPPASAETLPRAHLPSTLHHFWEPDLREVVRLEGVPDLLDSGRHFPPL